MPKWLRLFVAPFFTLTFRHRPHIDRCLERVVLVGEEEVAYRHLIVCWFGATLSLDILDGVSGVIIN